MTDLDLQIIKVKSEIFDLHVELSTKKVELDQKIKELNSLIQAKQGNQNG